MGADFSSYKAKNPRGPDPDINIIARRINGEAADNGDVTDQMTYVPSCNNER